jgi:FkbM family methyltransferase
MALRSMFKSAVNLPLALMHLQLVRRRVNPQHLYELCLREAFDGVDAPFVLDIGAHHGETALWILKHASRARIISFEPTPESFRITEAVAATHNFLAVNAAVGDTDGSMVLHLNSCSATNSLLEMDHRASLLDPQARREPQRVSVPVVRLDTFLETRGLDRPVDLMKIDVQGYEDRVLRGARRTLHRARTVMIEVQFNPVYKAACRVDEVCYRLYDMGFRLVRSVGYLRGHDIDQLVSSDFFFTRPEADSSKSFRT